MCRGETSSSRLWSRIICAVFVVSVTGSCERDAGEATSTPPPPVAESPIDFPAIIQVDDAEVNAFVRQVIETCASGDYEMFRLLWSVHEEPIARQEFERGWKALHKVSVLALQKMKTREGEILYYIHVRVELDDSVPNPLRELVLLIIREDDRWRLGRAPTQLCERVLGTDRDPTSPDATPSTQPSP